MIKKQGNWNENNEEQDKDLKIASDWGKLELSGTDIYFLGKEDILMINQTKKYKEITRKL